MHANMTVTFGFCAGLGTEPGACSIVSGEDNKGDGIVVCGQDPQAAIKERGWNTTVYKVRRCQKGADAVLGAAWVLDITLLGVVGEAGLLQGCVKDAHSAGWQPSERLWHFTMCRVCRSSIITN